jgi:hypothetical protein
MKYIRHKYHLLVLSGQDAPDTGFGLRFVYSTGQDAPATGFRLCFV